MILRKFERQVRDHARRLGFSHVRIGRGGKHPVLLAEYRGRSVSYTFAGTPSDSRRCERNIIADLKRLALQ